MKNKIYKVLLKLFGKDYAYQGAVQLNNNTPVICGDRILWLKTKTIKELTDNRACKKLIEEFNKDYPKYKGYIELW